MFVDIVMATYNGESYIRKQIESIQKQTYTHWRLLISDDNSTDNTVNIITEMSNIDDRIKIINIERQGGVIRNFAKALDSSVANYILFCDQDDLWPTERLEKMLTYFKKIEGDKPLMIFTDLVLIDDNEKIINNSYYKTNGIHPEENISFNRLRWKSSIYGCATMINKKLLDAALPFPTYATMHDHWLGLVALVKGRLEYYDYKSVYYRQHASNVVGGRSNSLLKKVKSLRKNLKKIEDAAFKTIVMQYELQERFSIKFNKFLFIKENIIPSLYRNSKKIYTAIFMVYFIKCSI